MRELNHKLVYFFKLKRFFYVMLEYKNIFSLIKVRCVIFSDSRETHVIEFKDTKRKLFNRGGIDSFILLTDA
jgi:hypothetical protein